MSREHAKILLLAERGRWKDAEVLIRGELAKFPESPELYLHLAEVLCGMDRPKEAAESARTAIGLAPDDGYPHEVLARALIESSNWKAAERAVGDARSLDGDNADLRSIVARVRLEQGRHQECLDEAESGLALDPDHDTCRFFRGVALGRLGRHEEADHQALGLLSDDPDDTFNHAARGWILLERNATAEARMHFQEALRLDPENDGARSGLARSLQQGNPILGWLLRATIGLGRIPFVKLLLGALILGVLLPRFLLMDGTPVVAKLVGQVLKAAVMSFFYLAVVVEPLFGALLFLKREGRNCLGFHQTRAVRWSLLPLVAGLVYLIIWMGSGARAVPFVAIGLLCSSALLHAAFSISHPRVRKKMLIFAGAGCAVAAWFLVGPVLLLGPMLGDLARSVSAFKAGGDSREIATALSERVKEILWVTKLGFTFPALALYVVTGYSGNIAEMLARRASDGPA